MSRSSLWPQVLKYLGGGRGGGHFRGFFSSWSPVFVPFFGEKGLRGDENSAPGQQQPSGNNIFFYLFVSVCRWREQDCSFTSFFLMKEGFFAFLGLKSWHGRNPCHKERGEEGNVGAKEEKGRGHGGTLPFFSRCNSINSSKFSARKSCLGGNRWKKKKNCLYP